MQEEVELFQFIAVTGVEEILDVEPEARKDQVIKDVVQVYEHPCKEAGEGCVKGPGKKVD